MSHHFEEAADYEFDLSPDTVWDAIATGPGLSSWFMGATDVDPDAGTVRTTMGSYVQESAIGAYEPGRHFSFRGAESPDGRFFAMEFLIEARASGSTVLRVVSSGFLPDDDWEAEYEAMLTGGRMYRHTLVEYLTHFTGRPGIAIAASARFGELDRRWKAIRTDLGVRGDESLGDTVRLTPTGLPEVVGVVDMADSETLGVRTGDGLYRFYRGYYASGVGHHLFEATDAAAATQQWQAWLDAIAS
ncbi:SRPBCC family protein [Agromyces bauzanensis]